MTGKKWTADDWESIFLDNYIMNILADKFIWTVYNKHDKILKHVKYDRQKNEFYTLDNEHYKLNKQYKLSLASPVEMSKEDVEKSKELLSKLNIKQPFNQMQYINFNFEEGDIKENIIVKYRNREVKIKTFKSLIETLDMELDYENSYIVGYKIIDSSISVGVKINLIGMDNAIEDNDIILFGDIVFYTVDSNETFSYKNIIDPTNSNVRYVNYIMFNIDSHMKRNSKKKSDMPINKKRRESDIQ